MGGTLQAWFLLGLSVPLLAGQQHSDARVVTAGLLRGPLRLDGNLDEEDWRHSEPAVDFVQSEPQEGQPATERTEVRVLQDESTLYLGVTCYDEDRDGIVVSELRQDFDPGNSDAFEVILDTFLDRRNGFLFVTNPEGARYDAQIADEGRNVNANWDGIWQVSTRRTEEGWNAEIAISFKSLRYVASDSIWGINFGRRIRRKNEVDYWSSLTRQHGITRVSTAGQLQGLRLTGRGRNLWFKPFLIGGFRDFRDSGREGQWDGGVDVKYGPTSGLTLDLTGNTDFSQVEVDNQQINLTRFPLFFPEKREFFLENEGIFRFGEIPEDVGGGEEEMLIFFSRRIGLSDRGEPVPILGGARLSGYAGPYGLGLMSIQTGSFRQTSGNNYTVLRARRNIFARSDVGAIFLNRSSPSRAENNRVGGMDANFRLLENLLVSSFLAKSHRPGVEEGTWAGKISGAWTGRLALIRFAYLDAEEHFENDTGFTPRPGVRKLSPRIDLRPRPRNNRWIREIQPHLSGGYYLDQRNRTVTKHFHQGMWVIFHNGARVEFFREGDFERLDAPFDIRSPLVISPGDYRFESWGLIGNSDQSRSLSGTLRYHWGGFWNGTKKEFRATGRWRRGAHFASQFTWTLNTVDLPSGRFRDTILGARLHYAFNTRAFFDAFLQYNSRTRKVSSNLRFNLIHRPLSDLFVVYNEERDAFPSAEAVDKSLTVKYTHLLTF